LIRRGDWQAVLKKRSYLCHLPSTSGAGEEQGRDSDPETERRCVRVRTYEVRVFVPTVYAIEAHDEQEALAKVAALYKELYAKDVRAWIEPLPEPGDM
jgi:hypothetical protein